MKLNQLCVAAVAGALLPLHAAQAQTRTETQTETRSQTQTQTQQTIREGDIYGSQLMTQQERNEYRARMQNAQTAEERERIRAEHHARMKERAKAQGYTLPDQPLAKPGGPAGPGGGAGAGGGRGR